MIYKTILILLLAPSIIYSVYGDEDDCGADLDLSLMYEFSFSGRNITLLWQPISQTECPLLYHLTIREYEGEVVQDDYLEEKSALLNVISPCVLYQISISAINEAFPTVEGPKISMGIDFSAKAQIAPRMLSVDIQATSFNMTWGLEGDTNRCPLRRLYVDGGKYFNITMPLQNLTDQSSVPVEITSLKANSMYYFQVYVENSGGLSPVTQLAVQTLDITN